MGKSGGNEVQKEEVKENGRDGGLDGENIKGRGWKPNGVKKDDKNDY